MLVTNVLLGTVLGAILWPILQQVVDSTNRAVLGLIIGGLIGGALSWAELGLYVSLIIGSSIGANVSPIETDIGLVFIEAILNTARGGAIGAIIVLSLRSISFVLTGAGIGLFFSLFLSVGLQLLNQRVLVGILSSNQMTGVVLIGSLLFFGILSSRK